jgi:hypothetical protein
MIKKEAVSQLGDSLFLFVLVVEKFSNIQSLENI